MNGDDVQVIGSFVGRDGGFVTRRLRPHARRDAVDLRVPVSRTACGRPTARASLPAAARARDARAGRRADPARHRDAGAAASRDARRRTHARLRALATGRVSAGRALRRRSGRTRSTTSSVRRPTRSFASARTTDDRPIAAVVSPELAALADENGTACDPACRPGRSRLRWSRPRSTSPGSSARSSSSTATRLAVALHALQPGAGHPTSSGSTPLRARSEGSQRALDSPPFDRPQVTSRATVLHDLRRRSAHPRNDPAAARGDGDRTRARCCWPCTSSPRPTRATPRASCSTSRCRAPSLVRFGATCGCGCCSSQCPGIVGGTVAGLALSRLVVRYVELTLTAEAPEPPLVLGRRLGAAAGRARGLLRGCRDGRGGCDRARPSGPRTPGTSAGEHRDRGARRVPRLREPGGERGCAAGPDACDRRRADHRDPRPERVGQVDAPAAARRARAPVGRVAPRVRREPRRTQAGAVEPTTARTCSATSSSTTGARSTRT